MKIVLKSETYLKGEGGHRAIAKRPYDINHEGSEISVAELKSIMSEKTFDPKTYNKVKEEIWKDSSKTPAEDTEKANDARMVTYCLYVEKK